LWRRFDSLVYLRDRVMLLCLTGGAFDGSLHD
jgi:hypothetical protein